MKFKILVPLCNQDGISIPVRPVQRLERKQRREPWTQCCPCLDQIPWRHVLYHFLWQFLQQSIPFKLFDKGLYGIGTARMDRKGMPKMKPDKQMKKGDHECQFTDKVTCCKWFDRRSVTMLFSNISGIQSTLTVQQRMKKSTTKIPVLCPNVI